MGRTKEWLWHKRVHLKQSKMMQNNTLSRLKNPRGRKNRQISIISISLRMLLMNHNNTAVSHQQMKMRTPKLPTKGNTYNNSTPKTNSRSLRIIKQYSR